MPEPSLSLDMPKWLQLQAVQDEVNAGTRYRADPDLYGRADYWAIAAGVGDCEDYALAKLRRLVELGWPREALRIATCWTDSRPDSFHAVLTVDTDKGTYVLDNRYPRVEPWSALPYRWHAREVPGAATWESIGGSSEAIDPQAGWPG